MMFNIGDKVRYIRKTNPFINYNSIGTITSVKDDSCMYTVLFSFSTKFCCESHLEKVSTKNQQLLFTFMEQENNV